MKLLYFFAICLSIAYARPGFEFQIGYQAKIDLKRDAGAKKITFEMCTGEAEDQCCDFEVQITGDTYTRYRRQRSVCKDLTIDPSHPPTVKIKLNESDVELRDLDIGYIVIENKVHDQLLVTFDKNTGTGTVTKPKTADCQFGEFSAWSNCSASCGGFGRQHQTRTVKHREFYTSDADGNSVVGAICKGPLTKTRPCNEQPCKGYRLQAQFPKGSTAGKDKSIDICTENGRCCEVALGGKDNSEEFFVRKNVCEELDTLFPATPPTVEVKVENSENGFKVEFVTLEDTKNEFEARWTDVNGHHIEQYETTSPTKMQVMPKPYLQ